MLYDYGPDKLAEWDTGPTFEVLLLAPSYTPDPSHFFVADLVPASNELTAVGYARWTVTSNAKVINTVPTPRREEYQCDNPDFGPIAIGTTYKYAVLFKFVTNDADSELVLCSTIDASGITTDGTEVVFPLVGAVIAYVDAP